MTKKTKNSYNLGTGYGSGVDWDDIYIEARDNAEGECYEEYDAVVTWLEENLEGKYQLIDEYENTGMMEVLCIMTLTFSDKESEMAYKMMWGELC